MNPTTSHINTFSRVLSELSSQGINFEEEVKALALLSSFIRSKSMGLTIDELAGTHYTTFANSCLKLNFDETIGQVLTEDIRWISMGLTIGESAEAYHSTESIEQYNWSKEQCERTGRNSSRPRIRGGRQRSKWYISRPSDFCTHCRKTSHSVSDCWSIKRKENGRRFEQNSRQSDSNRSPTGNQVNVAESW